MLQEHDDARAAAPAGLGGGLAAHTPLPRPGGVLASRGCPHPTARFAEEVGGKDICLGVCECNQQRVLLRCLPYRRNDYVEQEHIKVHAMQHKKIQP